VSAVANPAELLVVGLLNYLWPSFTLVLAIPLLGKQPTKWLPLGLLIVFAGIVLAKFSTSPNASFSELFESLNVVAYSCAVLDALAWGVYSNLSAKLSHPAGASGVPIYMVVASLLLLSVSQVIEPPSSPATSDWCLLVGWALASGLAYLSWDVGMRKGNVVTISVVSMLIPLFSTVITALLSGSGLTLYLLVAAALVVAGSALCRRSVT
jgi:drug/metabolite transporter (DMT)-like permease